MTYLSIIDKLVLFFNLLKESSFLLIFVGVLIFSIIFRILGKINNKKFLMITVLSLFGSFLAVLLMNYDILSKTFDNFLDIIFTNIYFPSIYVYLFVIISTYVIVIVTLLNKRISKVSRIANYIMAFVLNLLLVLNLNIIAKDKVDIFSTSSMYTNISLVSMLELSMNIYILWMVFVSAVFIINHVTDIIMIKRESRNLIKEPAIIEGAKIEVSVSELEERKDGFISNPMVECGTLTMLNIDDTKDSVEENVISTTVSEELKQEENSVVSEPKFINIPVIEQIKGNIEVPEKVEQPLAHSYTFNQYAKAEENKIVVPTISPILNQILTNTLPLQREEVKNTNEVFTLSDYKVFSKMLKEAIKLNNRTALNVGDMLNINLLNKFSYEEYSLFQRMLKSYTN